MAVLGSSFIETSIWKKTLMFSIAITILFWSMFALYLGANFDPTSHQDQISIYIVNFDQGDIGQTLDAMVIDRINGVNPTQYNTLPSNALGKQGSVEAGWVIYDPIQFGGKESNIELAVKEGNVWGAIVIRPNASSLLNTAADNADSNYDPRNAINIYYDEGRDPTSVALFVVRPMRALLEDVQAQFTRNFLKQRSSGNSSLSNIARDAPHIISTPVSWKENNVAKFTSFVTDAGLSIGLLMLIIFTFAASTIVIDLTQEHLFELSGSTMASLRLRMIIFFTLSLSLFFALVMAGYKANFTAISFLLFWVVHFIHLTVHALTFLIASLIASPAFQAPIFLFLLVINITAGLGTIDLANIFYRWSYAIPLWNAVTASRTILFGGFPRLGMNFGILCAWMATLLMLYVILQGKEQDSEEHIDNLQRTSTVKELEKSMRNTIRSSRQSLVIRENDLSRSPQHSYISSNNGSRRGTFDLTQPMSMNPSYQFTYPPGNPIGITTPPQNPTTSTTPPPMPAIPRSSTPLSQK